jgi:hypothetical protein
MYLRTIGTVAGLLALSGASRAGDIYTSEAEFLAAFEDNYLYLATFDAVQNGPHAQLLYEFPGSFSFVLSAPGGLLCSGGVVSTAQAGTELATDFPEAGAWAFGGVFLVLNQDLMPVPGQLTLSYPDGTVDSFHVQSDGAFRGYVSYEWAMDRVRLRAQAAGGQDARAAVDYLYTGKAYGGECYSDCNHDGALDLFDFFCFVEEFNAGRDYADCTRDGRWDLFDFLCLENEFNSSC